MSMTKEHYDELDNFCQGNLSVTEAVKRFNQLARLCPNMMPTEEEHLRRMLKMPRPFGVKPNSKIVWSKVQSG
ncbi:hypothetical protein TIFTF001_015195 [Ficus carica]|uniref:Retrotransposon gag domain-containing protein n=1 Tax=Ficus carica TaxID=3494 RepID=A0AA88A575_FICCA|nr:hypothetical protein TIFTF001_015195 [Ficus carica]